MKKLLVLFSLVLICTAIMAQTKLTGVVYDEGNQPLIGASIFIKGTSIGTVSDIDGGFTLETESNDGIFVVSFIGYQEVEKEFSSSEEFHIYLKLEATSLGDVMVIGYGYQSKSDMTGAVENVKIKGVTERPVNNMLQALQGNVSGVTVVNTGGNPTDSPMVRVRGIGTLSNEEPLYVVDGVPGASIPNVEDIQSISVLKDASSSAIYGVRAAAGVVLVETKKGKGSKNQIGLNCYWGVNSVSKKLHSLNAQEYADVMNLAFDNAGYDTDYAGRDYINPDKNPYGMVTRTNWIDDIFQSGLLQNYNVTANGSSDKLDYYSSFRYRKNEGTLLNTWHEVFDFRMNTTFRATNKLTISENFSYQYSNGNYGVNTSSGYTGAIISAIYYPASASVWEDKENGLYGGVAPRGSDYIGSYGDLINPVAYLNRLNDKKPTHTINGNLKLKYEFSKDFYYQLNVGTIFKLENQKRFTSKITEPGKIFNFNELYQLNNRSISWVVENTLNYSKSFGKSKLTALLGYTNQSYNREWFSMKAQGFSSESAKHQYFPNANGPFSNPDGGKTGNTLLSYLARINYSYDNRYLLSVTTRRDGSSKLLKDNRWGNFPSISAAWRVKNENFMKDAKFLSDLKIRAGWGKIGNLGALSDFPASVPLLRTQALLGSPANYDSYLGFAENEISNIDVSWETTTQTNFGLDFSFLERKLSGSFDFFIKNTDDMLLRAPVQGTAGVSNGPWENIGSIENKGAEFSLSYSNYDRSLKYSFGVNLSKVSNKVESLSDQYDYISHTNSVRGILQPLRTEVGNPIYSYYVYENDGIFQNENEVSAHKNAEGELLQPLAKAGDLRFVDRNKNGQIDDDDRYFAGSGFPKLTFGINGSLEYKNFDLQFLFQGATGYKVFNGLKFSTLKPTQGYNMLDEVLDAWSENNTDSNIPRVSLKDENNNFGTASDWYLEDASYLRLKNVTIGYKLPVKLASKLSLQSARVYISSDNLLTLTDYSGFDPEVISDHGIDMGNYPSPKTFIVGVNVKF